MDLRIMANDIKELFVYKDEQNNVFSSDKEYRIPLYQRAYAWGDKQLLQLLEDIRDNNSDRYYIGSLVVSDKGDFYEVVDGQQRLTSLFLLLTSLNKDVKPTLTFACREKSNYTLRHLNEILDGASVVDQDKVQESIANGMRLLKEELSNTEKYGEDFVQKLANVVLYRITVPPHTDLNRYFETMNTRGEQLEPHDILKAHLMSYYGERIKEEKSFACIWDACANMDGYVQMHFDKTSREHLFGGYWCDLPSKSSVRSFCASFTASNKESGVSLSDVANNGYRAENYYSTVDEDGSEVNVRFEGIIEFPYFLLHCLKTFVEVEKLSSDDGKNLYDQLLDDKKLNIAFERVLKHGIQKRGEPLNGYEFSKKFILHLLRTRFLFDKYILKREYIGDSLDGEWSIKTLCVSGIQSKKKAYFKNTDFRGYGQWKNTKDNKVRHPNNLMMQSALRVSYTSPKVMHWITTLLLWLSNDHNLGKLNSFCDEAENVARESVRNGFFDVCADGNYLMGVNTPHIVFNYLDYLIWKQDRTKYKDFQFEFRNSVEHWYPRHPSESELPIWDDKVDTFGNLCIIQRNVNSKFSNLPPEGKKISFDHLVTSGSLKLRIMSEATVKQGDVSGSQHWREDACAKHEAQMIEILKNACGLNDNEN